MGGCLLSLQQSRLPLGFPCLDLSRSFFFILLAKVQKIVGKPYFIQIDPFCWDIQ